MNALALAKLACAAHATIVLLPRFEARAYIEAIARYRPTWLTAVPPMIAMMLREARRAGEDRPLQRRVHPHGLGAGQREPDGGDAPGAFPRPRSPTPTARPKPGPVVFGPHPKGLPQPEASVGYPHPKVELRLVDGDNRDADQGVLEMKAPAVMNGYHNRPDVKPPITADGFYITGDVFRRDEDGFHYFVGRTDDMFVSGGENIYPADVERMLERHPDVGQAVVIPVDDDIKGTKPVAFVIPKAGQKPTEDDDQAVRARRTRRPISTRASSGSSTNCRSPRPTRSIARRCESSRRSGWRPPRRLEQFDLQADAVDHRLPALHFLGHVLPRRHRAVSTARFRSPNAVSDFSNSGVVDAPSWWRRRSRRSRAAASRPARRCRGTAGRSCPARPARWRSECPARPSAAPWR